MQANERLDMMDGDHAELRDHIGRLEEELQIEHEKSERLQEVPLLNLVAPAPRKPRHTVGNYSEIGNTLARRFARKLPTLGA